MTARSSTCEMEARHDCPAAARHQSIGTPRDIAGMLVGTCVHHLLERYVTRPEGTDPVSAIDKTTAELIANGRSFEGQRPEFPTLETANRARDLALDFLDRDEVPTGSPIYAELGVNLNRWFKPTDQPDPRGWHQTIDVLRCYEEYDEDGRPETVVEIIDYKGGNISAAWMESLQGKGAAVVAAALYPKADYVRRRVVSYFTWGGKHEHRLDMRHPDDIDTLQEYRHALEVAIAGEAARQGRDPDELATPGAGCFASFDGCPFFAHCRPAQAAWSASASIRPNDDPRTAARAYVLATAQRDAAAKVIKARLRGPEAAGVVKAGKSAVGWVPNPRSVPSTDAPMILAREWVERMGALDPGSRKAIELAAYLHGVLGIRHALTSQGVRAIIGAMSERMLPDEAEAMVERCLDVEVGRKLKAWALDYDTDPDMLSRELKQSARQTKTGEGGHQQGGNAWEAMEPDNVNQGPPSLCEKGRNDARQGKGREAGGETRSPPERIIPHEWRQLRASWMREWIDKQGIDLERIARATELPTGRDGKQWTKTDYTLVIAAYLDLKRKGKG